MIRTDRLILREWRKADIAPLAAMSCDPAVMAFIGPFEDEGAVRAMIAGQIRNQSLFGHCFWPVGRCQDGAFLGFCGLQLGPEQTPIQGEIEIGWQLARHAWGRGFARDAAEACLTWGWGRAMPRIAAITVPANARSRVLMARLAMRRRPDLDFAHPAAAADDPLSHHIVHVIDRPG